jgi:hypothetical protein
VWIPFAIGADGNVGLEPIDSWSLEVFDEGYRPGAVTDLRCIPDGAGRMKLAWSLVAGAHAYRVYANQRYVAMTSEPEFSVPPQFPGVSTSWKVAPWHLRHGAGIASSPIVIESQPARDCWLDEHVPDRWHQGYASPSSRRNVLGGPLKICGRTFDRGIGTHGPSELCYFIGGEFGRFEFVAGIDDAHPGRARFGVYGDGRALWSSDCLATGEAQRTALDVAGVRELRLVVSQVADAPGAYAVWAEARLLVSHSTLQRTSHKLPWASS